MRTLRTITFVYEPRQDRILAAINASHADAWSCWLTRRLALALIDRMPDFLTSTSGLAKRAPAELRGETIAFEREAAIAKTAGAMSPTPPDILKTSAGGAELAERLSITPQGDAFRLELHGQPQQGAAGVLTRAELQRILQMLHGVVVQAAWLGAPATPQAAPAPAAPAPKPARH
jgi:hypothetical protein